jgi:hypothetical protein
VRNCGWDSLHFQQNRTKHAEQGVPFCLFVRPLGALEFRFQLRQRLGLWVPQDELDRGNNYRLTPRRLRNLFAIATAQSKHSMTRFMPAKNNLPCGYLAQTGLTLRTLPLSGLATLFCPSLLR